MEDREERVWSGVNLFKMTNAELFAGYPFDFENIYLKQGEKTVATEDGGIVCVKYDFGYEVGLLRPSAT